MVPRFFQYWQLSSYNKKNPFTHKYIPLFFKDINVYTKSMNESLKSLCSNFRSCFKLHKHLVTRNWHICLFVNTSEIFDMVLILTSAFKNLYIINSTLNLSTKGFILEIMQNYLYLKEYKFTSMNVKSRIM